LLTDLSFADQLEDLSTKKPAQMDKKDQPVYSDKYSDSEFEYRYF